MTQQANRDAWRKFLGITDARNGRADSRTGVGVGRSAGRASGAGSTDRDGNPEGQAGESAENGDGSLNGGKGLQVGDKGDRLTDLYDCETGEEVTIDGLGEKGTEAYPSGFHDCIKKPSSDVYYFQGRVFTVLAGSVQQDFLNKNYSSRNECVNEIITSLESGGEPYRPSELATEIAKLNSWQSNVVTGLVAYKGDAPTRWYEANRRLCADNPSACDELNKWPVVDKNHLNWNKEKGCFEPLCPEFNTQVSDKYKGCEGELELCDAPVGGKKVKVKINNGVTEVTQERYNQTATIKDGKVTSVKALSESQTEAAFR